MIANNACKKFMSTDGLDTTEPSGGRNERAVRTRVHKWNARLRSHRWLKRLLACSCYAFGAPSFPMVAKG